MRCSSDGQHLNNRAPELLFIPRPRVHSEGVVEGNMFFVFCIRLARGEYPACKNVRKVSQVKINGVIEAGNGNCVAVTWDEGPVIEANVRECPVHRGILEYFCEFFTVGENGIRLPPCGVDESARKGGAELSTSLPCPSLCNGFQFRLLLRLSGKAGSFWQGWIWQDWIATFTSFGGEDKIVAFRTSGFLTRGNPVFGYAM